MDTSYLAHMTMRDEFVVGCRILGPRDARHMRLVRRIIAQLVRVVATRRVTSLSRSRPDAGRHHHGANAMFIYALTKAHVATGLVRQIARA
jgi:hypothetical protein